MRTYIGSKIILATPMDELSFYQEKHLVFDKGENRSGYKVIYPDGYVSWSPKETFEEAYRPVNEKESELLLKG